MKWQSMTRYFVILIIVLCVSIYMIRDFKEKYQLPFGFESQKKDF